MKGYENFSPEIEDNEQRKPSEVLQPKVSTDETPAQGGSSADVSAPKRQRRTSTRQPAKRKAKTATAKTKAKAKQAPTLTPGVKETVMEWANQKSLKLILGIFMLLFGAYLSIAFISYLSTCIADQSAILSEGIGTAKDIKNAAGEGGARISNFLINDTFGVGSIVLIIWLFAMSLKQLVGKPKFKSVNFTIKCLVALIALSLIIGLVTYGLNSQVNWGGYHGRYINEFIMSFFGPSGAIILCIFAIAVFVVICLRDIANWIMRLKRARDKRRAELKVLEEEQLAKRRALMEDEKRERAEAQAAGDAPEEEAPQAQAPVVQFAEDDREVVTPEPAQTVTPEDEDIDSYVLTDEEEIRMNHAAALAKQDGNISEYSIEDEPADAPAAQPTGSAPNGGTEAQVEVMEIKTNTIKQGDDTQAQASTPLSRYPYTFPPTDILRPGPERINVDRSEQLENQERIRQTLLDFKIPIESIDATVGPTVTLYEIVPATGVKVNTISKLVDDIALRLSAIGVRIIAPIPGRGTIGIEVANKDPQIVSMRSIINSEKFKNTKYRLPIALGATIENDVYIADLAKMPHLLVAGATGQGKSVGLNAIIASLLYSKTPDQVKFVMIDPKMVEFSLYAKIEEHYLAKLPDETEPIITEMDKVVSTLSSLCVEMDERYKLLKGHARNVEEYNDKFLAGKLNTYDGHRFLPYIVVIVDEFSDLIMVAGKEVEMPIARLAQKARAVGMHVIIATQRPSTTVITGNIKANFPARISFKVTSGVDSKTILDQTGAQQLIGRGDMLISNNSEIVRVQCAFIDTPEVEEIVDYIADQPHAPGAYILPEPILQGASGEEEERGYGGTFAERDPLLVEAGRSVVMSNQASTSSLQRRYSIGYVRAGKIMDQLEALGVVGPSQGSKPRPVLMDAMTFEETIARQN